MQGEHEKSRFATNIGFYPELMQDGALVTMEAE